MARGSYRGHHPVRADRDDAIAFAEGDRLLAKRARRIRAHGFDDVANEALVLWPAWNESRSFVAAPHDGVRRRFDIRHLVAVDHLSVARKVEDFRAGIAERLPDGKQHRIAEAAASKDHRFAAFDLGGRARRTHEHDGFARLELHAKIR